MSEEDGKTVTRSQKRKADDSQEFEADAPPAKQAKVVYASSERVEIAPGGDLWIRIGPAVYRVDNEAMAAVCSRVHWFYEDQGTTVATAVVCCAGGGYRVDATVATSFLQAVHAKSKAPDLTGWPLIRLLQWHTFADFFDCKPLLATADKALENVTQEAFFLAMTDKANLLILGLRLAKMHSPSRSGAYNHCVMRLAEWLAMPDKRSPLDRAHDRGHWTKDLARDQVRRLLPSPAVLFDVAFVMLTRSTAG